MTDRLYFRQLLSGRDFATTNSIAKQMVNFVYIVGDRDTKQAMIIDPAWGTRDLVDIIEADGMELVGALATHYHADHVGGTMMGHNIDGISDLLSIKDIPIHLQAAEVPWVTRTTGVSADHIVEHQSGDVVMVGEIPIQLIHTPGHTPGSQCFFVDNCLLAGDTLFLEGCGRTDLPGSDPSAMYDSLTQKLAHIPDSATLFPGHLYSPEGSQSMGETREYNYVFKPKSAQQWMAMFGG